jgi:exonuclease VII large subunit
MAGGRLSGDRYSCSSSPRGRRRTALPTSTKSSAACISGATPASAAEDLPPAEQERQLQNDPAFRRLSPEKQQQLRQRLEHFSGLPPQQQLRMLNRMETWEHLTPEQKQQARQIFGQLRQLPPDRQRQVTTAVRDLRAMPPDQRERVIESDRFKSMFSDQERDLMRGATRLPLAPAEGGEATP